MARVNKRVKDNKDNPIGIEQPILFSDHSILEVSFPNGQREELTANVIAEKMISQVDSDRYHYQVLK